MSCIDIIYSVATVHSIIMRTKNHESKELMLIGKKSMNNILNPVDLPKLHVVDV